MLLAYTGYSITQNNKHGTKESWLPDTSDS
jgi:hypothetical protein